MPFAYTAQKKAVTFGLSLVGGAVLLAGVLMGSGQAASCTVSTNISACETLSAGVIAKRSSFSSEELRLSAHTPVSNKNDMSDANLSEQAGNPDMRVIAPFPPVEKVKADGKNALLKPVFGRDRPL